jgi:hypothetical protein
MYTFANGKTDRIIVPYILVEFYSFSTMTKVIEIGARNAKEKIKFQYSSGLEGDSPIHSKITLPENLAFELQCKLV